MRWGEVNLQWFQSTVIMAEVDVELGALYPLKDDQEVDLSSPKLPIHPGLNVFGRTDSPLFTKQVSRKHISILVSSGGLLEVTVEGPNAVVLVSGGVRTKLGRTQKSQLRGGDVVEFIPHGLPFRYISASVSSPRKEEESVIVVENSLEKQQDGRVALPLSHMMENSPRNDRNAQIESDEALARLLQAQEDAAAGREAGDVAGDEAEDEIGDEDEDDDGEWAFQNFSSEQKRQIEADEAFAKQMQDEEDAANAVDMTHLSGVGPDDTHAEVVRHPTDLDAFSLYLQGQREAANRNLIEMGRLAAGRGPGAATLPAGIDAPQIAASNAVMGEGPRGGAMVNRPAGLDELATYLQEERERAVRNAKGKARLGNDEQQSGERGVGLNLSGVEAEFKRPKIELQESNRISFAFSLLSTRNLRPGANARTVQLKDVVRGDICFALLSNYMVDIPWLLEACPLFKNIPRVVVVHGETGASFERLVETKPKNWDLFKPNLPISYGTYHSKAMILVYPRGVRVVVHTANYIYIDFNNKTQGLWMQDFPIKSAVTTDRTRASPFENDLVEYLEALAWPGVTATLPVIGPTLINARFFRTFDYSLASVRLVASVPGYHPGFNKTKWGHMKLRKILQEEVFDDEFRGASMVYQFSSIGSLDEKWIGELTTSVSAGSTAVSREPLGLGKVQMVWPTVNDVRDSLEGYAAGNSVPSPEKNVKKDFLRQFWAKWDAHHTGRQRAIPHMKSYVRYKGQSVAWLLLTSSNLSKAAWGALQKNESQLMIRSYELGVLFLPSLAWKASKRWFSCTEPMLPHPGEALVPSLPGRGKLLISNNAVEEERHETDLPLVRLPLPYSLPPQPYGPADVPWSWDRSYLEPDIFGEPWPRPVRMYL